MKTLKELREESKGQTRMLWHSNFWDCPLSGVILWNGQKAWFDKVDERTDIEPWSEEEIKDWLEYESSKDDKDKLAEDEYFHYDTHFIYKVYRVHPDFMEHLEDNHRDFQDNVGTHCDYDENGNRHHNLKPYELHGNYYKKDKKVNVCYPPLDKSDSNVIGEFEY
jgi:hypothetical protein